MVSLAVDGNGDERYLVEDVDCVDVVGVEGESEEFGDLFVQFHCS